VHPASTRRPVVGFTKYAWVDLRNEAMGFDGEEVGGALFGKFDRAGNVLVEYVCGPSDWAERDANTFVIERSTYLAIERARARLGQVWLGDWHTHDELVPRPSPNDFRGWRAAVRRAAGLYLGILATPDPHPYWRFDAPSFAAWVARDGVCVPAIIEIEAERTFSWQRAQ
jgi:hypothetical protein